MKRSEFLKEMGSSFFQTVKSVYDPFIQEDLEKVEEAADRALGIQWMPLMKADGTIKKLEMRYIEGKPIIVSRYGTDIQARNGICPVCSNIIIVSTLYSSGKCLNCENEFNFQSNSGTLQLESLEVKKKDQMYFVGLLKWKKQGGYDA